jgi:GNAT superfamily N-acetyltransferase
VNLKPVLREGRDDDANGFIDLISACWAEYPGCIMDLDGEVPELRALASYYAAQGGALWAAESGGTIAGMVATRPLGDGAWELCKMYAAADQRGSGLAQSLCGAVESHARAAGGTRLKLWTDTRFDRAHRFYEKQSFVRAGPIRALGDISNSIEFAYAKPVAGVVVERLDAAASASAEGRLAIILRDCVEDGASVSFLPPMDLATARAFWKRKSAEVAAGGRVLLAAWVDGTLAGTVMLDLAMPENQQHRADLQKLLVQPTARRRGAARLLMQHIEQHAHDAGRSLLVLDTRAGDPSESLYRDLCWQECGRIPDFAANGDGSMCDTVLFYKRILESRTAPNG